MRIKRVSFLVGLVLLFFSFVIGYRVHAANEALEYAPSSATPVVLLPGTTIDGIMNNGIDRSAEPGDSVVAIVSKAVVFDGRIVIPLGAKLQGKLQKLAFTGEKAKATVGFVSLVIGGRDFTIETQRVRLVAPVRSEMDILSTAFKALVGASLGGSLGAESNDPLMIRRGMVEGVNTSISGTSPVRFTLTLTSDLDI